MLGKMMCRQVPILPIGGYDTGRYRSLLVLYFFFLFVISIYESRYIDFFVFYHD